MMRAIPLVSLAAILVLAGLLGWHAYRDTQVTHARLPALTLVPLEGHAGFDPAALDHAYLLNVWGSWCAACRIEHPVLMALKAEGYPIYGLNWRDEPDAANAFLETLGNPYVGVMQDVEGASARALDITGAPETLVVSAEGEILVRWAGPITADVLRNRIYPALDREARR